MHFRISPTDSSNTRADLIVENEASILAAVRRLNCGEADVLADDVYAFTLRYGENGLWCIFQREYTRGEFYR